MDCRLALLSAASPLLLAVASAPVAHDAQPAELELKQARSEARAAEADMRRLEQAAARARDEVARLAAERQAAAAAIAASEAQISVADAEVSLTEARVAQNVEKLSRRQAPLAALLAGIVTMGRRPPLLSSGDSQSLDEFVRVRALLDTTLPVIRQRSAALSAELAESRRGQAEAARARGRLAEARKARESRQQRFAALEAKAAERAANLGAGMVGASDVLVASSESAARIHDAAERRKAELKLAADLGALPAAAARPGKDTPAKPPLAYQFPVAAKVLEGLASVSDTGVRSRGLTLDSYAGQQVVVPAGGVIAFAGPFRRHDGVVIINHGKGWMTLMTAVRTELHKGDRVRPGQILGRALGPVTVELSAKGTPISAAIIAGSSQLLFIKGKSG